ncbi:MAG: hypothetical protein V1721_03310 [Pseudomonadota bacterium]
MLKEYRDDRWAKVVLAEIPAKFGKDIEYVHLDNTAERLGKWVAVVASDCVKEIEDMIRPKDFVSRLKRSLKI